MTIKDVVASLEAEGYKVDVKSVRVSPGVSDGYHRCDMCRRMFDEDEDVLLFWGSWAGGWNTHPFCLDRVACHANIAEEKAKKELAETNRVSRVESRVTL